jgi:hypothetical protein
VLLELLAALAETAPPPCPPVVVAIPVEFVAPLSLHAQVNTATSTRMRAVPNPI